MAHTCHNTYVEVNRKLAGFSSLLSSCGPWGSNSVISFDDKNLYSLNRVIGSRLMCACVCVCVYVCLQCNVYMYVSSLWSQKRMLGPLELIVNLLTLMLGIELQSSAKAASALSHRLSLKLPYILRKIFSYNWGVLLEMKSNFHFEIINDERRLWKEEECDEVDNARKFL